MFEDMFEDHHCGSHVIQRRKYLAQKADAIKEMRRNQSIAATKRMEQKVSKSQAAYNQRNAEMEARLEEVRAHNKRFSDPNDPLFNPFL